MIKLIDDILDRITMYRLVLYYLLALLAAAFVFSFAALLPVGPADLAFSAVLIVAVCWITNAIFVRVFRVPESTDSVLITALILTLIMNPAHWTDWEGVGALAFASVWAMAGKYIFAVGRRHIFNPAALAVALTGVLLDQPATWWVAGNQVMLAFVLIGGLLTTRKLQRGALVASCFAATAIVLIATSPLDEDWTAIVNTVLYSPILFLAFVMLTEPLTTPPRRRDRII